MTEKNLGGRPRKEIDYTLLDKLCSIQCTGEETASVLGMSYESLNNKLKEEGHGGFLEYFKKKSATGKMSLRRKQMETALAGNVGMLIWLGKQYLGQKDRIEQQSEISGPDGGAIKNEWTIRVVE